jgi:hypothetical protein
MGKNMKDRLNKWYLPHLYFKRWVIILK